MRMHTLQVKIRTSGKANAVRRGGYVPAVVYGPSIESTPVTIEQKALHILFSEITRSSRINLSISGDGGTREVDVFVKDVDRDPISDEPLHVDFYHPDAGHPLKLQVPMRIVGECKGVKAGGILNVLFNTIPVHGLPQDIPHLITIDVSDLIMGESIHVRDIDFGGVEPLLPPERTLVTVIAPRGLSIEETEEGIAEGEEAAELGGEAPVGGEEEAETEGD